MSQRGVQPDLETSSSSAALQKHELVEPCRELHENICSHHHEEMKLFCRTDQQSICYLCSVEEHKGHDIVSAAAERTERERELEGSRHSIQQRIQIREKEVKQLQQEVEAVNRSADKSVEDSEEMFTQLIRLLEKRRSEVKQKLRSQQDREVSRVRELQEELEQEIRDLKRRNAELELLSHTEDPHQFLHSYSSLPALSVTKHSSSTRPLRYFEDVTAAVSAVRDKVQDILRDEWTDISLTGTEVEVLWPESEPRTRAGFLQYAREITLDPDSAYRGLMLSQWNRRATLRSSFLACSSILPDRFTDNEQVLSRETLTGRCYWEVEWRGLGGVSVAVAYKDISRAGGSDQCVFGRNDNSWALDCNHHDFKFKVCVRRSSRVGVYLDHGAGVLSFYSISDTMTLLHRVRTTFTQPLHAGVRLYYFHGDTAELCKLK